MIKTRKGYVDLLKIISIFLVILFHTRMVNKDIANGVTLDSVLSYTMYNFLALAVPMFIFINGYLTFHKNKESEWSRKKQKNIVGLAIFWSIVYFIISNKANMSLEKIIHVLMNYNYYTYGSLWFLFTLFGVYLFAPFLYNIYQQNRKYFLYFLVVVFIFTFLNNFLKDIVNSVMFLVEGQKMDHLVLAKNGEMQFNPFQNLREINFGSMLLYYVFGGLVKELQQKGKHTWSRMTYFLIFAASFVLQLLINVFLSKSLHETYYNAYGNYQSPFILVAVVAIFLCMSTFSFKSNALINNLGANTLGIYLLHRPLLEIIKKEPFLVNSIDYLKLTFLREILIASLVFIICWVLTIILKKIPFISKVFMM